MHALETTCALHAEQKWLRLGVKTDLPGGEAFEALGWHIPFCPGARTGLELGRSSYCLRVG